MGYYEEYMEKLRKEREQKPLTEFKDSLSDILRGIASYNSGVTSLLNYYKMEKERYQDENIYAKSFSNEQIKALRSNYSTQISSLNSSLAGMGEKIELSRRLYSQLMTDFPEDTKLLENLAVYKNLNMNLSERDLLSLAGRSKGNFIALRAIAEIGRASGFSVNIPIIDQFEKTMSGIESFVKNPCFYQGNDESSSYADASAYWEIMSGYSSGDHASEYYGLNSGDHSSGRGNIKSFMAKITVDQLEEYIETLTNAIETGDLVSISTLEDTGEALGKRLGEKTNEKQEKSSVALDSYAVRE